MRCLVMCNSHLGAVISTELGLRWLILRDLVHQSRAQLGMPGGQLPIGVSLHALHDFATDFAIQAPTVLVRIR